jgi:hypothetical protein
MNHGQDISCVYTHAKVHEVHVSGPVSSGPQLDQDVNWRAEPV